MHLRSLAGWALAVTTANTAFAEEPPRLYVKSGLVFVQSKPTNDSFILGAIHGGQGVGLRSQEAEVGPGCSLGWIAIEPRGFVCPDPGSTTMSADDREVVAAAEVLPTPATQVPMHYGVSKGAPRYRRIPLPSEQKTVERGTKIESAPLDATISASPSLRAFLRQVPGDLTLEQEAFEGFKIAWTKEIQDGDRTFVVTPDLALIPKDRIKPYSSPDTKGVNLREQPMKFPLGYAWLEDAPIFERTSEGLQETDRVLTRHGFVELTGKLRTQKGKLFAELSDGMFVRQNALTTIKPYKTLPKDIGAHDKWISVRVTHGFFIAYEGLTPVYVGPISPGIDGIANRPHATPRGRFIVRAKRISVMMDGNDRGKYWRVDDVPFTQFFKGSLALHAAWWHDDFGRPKSHGCVNLPPADAFWLWSWSEPLLPKNWYAVQSVYPDVPATKIVIRP